MGELYWKYLGWFDRAMRWVLLFGVHGYQRTLSIILGGQCRFVPSCSHYAEEALQRGPLFPALGLIIWRIARCQPLCRGGFDSVPDWLNQRRDRMIGNKKN
jgi:uncharacterized protein